HAVAGASVRQLAAEARQQVAAGRPAQAAHLGRRRGGRDRAARLGRLAALRRLPCLLARTLLGGALFRRRPRRGRAQVLQQLLQRLGILAQGFLARLAVLVAAVQLGQQRSALAAVAAQRGQGFLLAGAQRLQLGTA